MPSTEDTHSSGPSERRLSVILYVLGIVTVLFLTFMLLIYEGPNALRIIRIGWVVSIVYLVSKLA
ncbi:hypothetical protein GRX03_10605 [Halovenus sp. WSH3]|uniref:Uncharacterized protein n=1 Tax=Halovenus carboxidivorans TaxID=2692199 RepID=A0A6B0T512_9EURY|nr:hypothetical protein [Halovenus carboxidivorans]MXR52047.1 hypothetical protein [Halovenus carboxidivorans]